MSDEHGPDIPEQRQYLPTLSDLIDRLSIVMLKSIFIDEHRAEYLAERALIEHDIGMLIAERPFSALDIRAVLSIMLANREIWLNESKARQGGDDQDKLLKFTHSINGVRNTAKNLIAAGNGERVDLKTDCLAAGLAQEFGNWDLFGG